ncbi:GNAT family N-acetyltransferase [Salinisphaera sp.]|uniref:GNAT family N-acetyltransferase n=1 Tax=Salinisphaera sp. TaxID=1914330 RepID=UPI0025F0BECD|nr:GNAT family N-acetyltransferase [Salinisphaera sp.]
MTQRSVEAATVGLAASLFAVEVRADDAPVGMGRVIGDGGCFFQVSDIAVIPAHRRRGVGRMIMDRITTYLRKHAPADAYISLIADGDSHHLYRRYGFVDTAPHSIGMKWPHAAR